MSTKKHPARYYIIYGHVQGVGFRPFIYQLAHRYALVGWVKNVTGCVHVHAQAPHAALEQFYATLSEECPPLAKIQHISITPCQALILNNFSILPSEMDTQAAHIHLPPDYFTCDACLAELYTPTDRRYRYPFINCTQCGARYTLINKLPYDRPFTSMADFPLCKACEQEYTTPENRRFHAQPIACPDCGPSLQFSDKNKQITDTELALAATINALQAGQIVAIKGIGGYHLCCDARNEATVKQLRQRKHRPDKAFAVMFPWQKQTAIPADLTEQVLITVEEYQYLSEPERAIYLLEKAQSYSLAASIAPNNTHLGVILPYSPLHHLLLNDFSQPIVITSANLSGEPVLTDQDSIETRLAHIAEAYLHHNRPIVRPADDSVYQICHQHKMPIRLGRGSAPVELRLPFRLSKPILAVGAQLKNTVALAWKDRCVLSPHIGELSSPRSVEVFQQVIEDLQTCYHIEATHIIHDAHPQYQNSRWAQQQNLPTHAVLHHHAHASALMSEMNELPSTEAMCVITWDGTGMGEAQQLWGGEIFYGKPAHWQRIGSIRPFRLIGGDKASREPWRCAQALCWEAGITTWESEHTSPLFHHAWQQGLNSPYTSSIGRLFDAAASLLGLLDKASYEGQAAILVEQHANTKEHDFIELPLIKKTHYSEIDWSLLIEYLLDTRHSIAKRAGVFHRSLAHAAVKQVCESRQYTHTPIQHIGLSGGVFQNRYLAQLMIELFKEKGFTVTVLKIIPCNDASISIGQIIDAAHTLHLIES